MWCRHIQVERNLPWSKVTYGIDSKRLRSFWRKTDSPSVEGAACRGGRGSAVGTVSVVVLPLSRLVNVASGGFGLSGSAFAQQVEAAKGVARQLLALHVVTDALSQADVLGLLQKACVSSDQSGCVAARSVTRPTLNFRSTKTNGICQILI